MAYLVLFALSLAAAGLSERWGNWWLLPTGVIVAVGALFATFSRRY